MNKDYYYTVELTYGQVVSLTSGLDAEIEKLQNEHDKAEMNERETEAMNLQHQLDQANEARRKLNTIIMDNVPF